VAPAFASNRQAAAFALLLAVLLALPMLVGGTGWLDRRDVYPSIPWRIGPFSWIQQQIFDETKDVDIAFLGSSQIWSAVDTPFVQKTLSEQLGREAEVITLGWPWSGFDASYLIARDLLDHRRVRMLVVYDEYGNQDTPHVFSSRWFRVGENPGALAGLPWYAQIRLYGVAVLGMPRHLLSLVRPNLLEDPARSRPNHWTLRYFAPNPANQLGSIRARLAFNHSPDFVPFEPRGNATPRDAVAYSPATRDAFQFTGPATPPYSLHFARKLALLCQERGTHLVFLHTPKLRERGQTVVTERQNWPEVLDAPVDIVGVPPAKLFDGIPDADLPKLFYENAHLNQNGQDLFTPLITPELITLYDSSKSLRR
jgi:hypothetical protein